MECLLVMSAATLVRFICPATLSRAKFRQAPIPSNEGLAIYQTYRRSEKSPLKTPALRHFQIRGHRETGPHFEEFGMGIFALVIHSNHARAGRCRCANLTRELPDALERTIRWITAYVMAIYLHPPARWTILPIIHMSRVSSPASATFTTLAFLPAPPEVGGSGSVARVALPRLALDVLGNDGALANRLRVRPGRHQAARHGLREQQPHQGVPRLRDVAVVADALAAVAVPGHQPVVGRHGAAASEPLYSVISRSTKGDADENPYLNGFGRESECTLTKRG